MGDYDPQADDWGLADEHGGYAHVIICTSRWLDRGQHQHQTVHDVRERWRAFYDTKAGVTVWPCDWLIEAGLWDDGTPRLQPSPCSAPARYIDDEGSYTCVNGHEHITMARRRREGWDYAADEDEAYLLRRYGVDAVSMRGGSI